MSLSGQEPLKVLLWAKHVPLDSLAPTGHYGFPWVWTKYLRTIINGLRFFSNQRRQRFWGNSPQVKGKEFVETHICHRTFREQVGSGDWQCGQNGVSAEGQPQATNCTMWLTGHMENDIYIFFPTAAALFSTPPETVLSLPKYTLPTTGLSQNH